MKNELMQKDNSWFKELGYWEIGKSEIGKLGNRGFWYWETWNFGRPALDKSWCFWKDIGR